MCGKGGQLTHATTSCMHDHTHKQKCLALNGYASSRYQLVSNITGTPLLKMRTRKLKKEKNFSNT